jgi:hypothetical protein
MPDKDEKARRKQMLHAVREDMRRRVREGLPVAVPMLKALFDYVDSQLDSTECDHTLRHVRDFIRSRELPEESVVSWLESNGGYCDCEAVRNAEQVVEEAVPGYDDLTSAE